MQVNALEAYLEVGTRSERVLRALRRAAAERNAKLASSQSQEQSQCRENTPCNPAVKGVTAAVGQQDTAVGDDQLTGSTVHNSQQRTPAHDDKQQATSTPSTPDRTPSTALEQLPNNLTVLIDRAVLALSIAYLLQCSQGSLPYQQAVNLIHAAPSTPASTDVRPAVKPSSWPKAASLAKTRMDIWVKALCESVKESVQQELRGTTLSGRWLTEALNPTIPPAVPAQKPTSVSRQHNTIFTACTAALQQGCGSNAGDPQSTNKAHMHPSRTIILPAAPMYSAPAPRTVPSGVQSSPRQNKVQATIALPAGSSVLFYQPLYHPLLHSQQQLLPHKDVLQRLPNYTQQLPFAPVTHVPAKVIHPIPASSQSGASANHQWYGKGALGVPSTKPCTTNLPPCGMVFTGSQVLCTPQNGASYLPAVNPTAGKNTLTVCGPHTKTQLAGSGLMMPPAALSQLQPHPSCKQQPGTCQQTGAPGFDRYAVMVQHSMPDTVIQTALSQSALLCQQLLGLLGCMDTYYRHQLMMQKDCAREQHGNAHSSVDQGIAGIGTKAGGVDSPAAELRALGCSATCMDTLERLSHLPPRSNAGGDMDGMDDAGGTGDTDHQAVVMTSLELARQVMGPSTM